MVQPVGAIPPEAVARMTAAEARLYPLAMVDPDLYERAIAAVGLVATRLRESCRTVEEVLGQREALLGVLPRVAADSGLSLSGLASDNVVDAASALVCRQLQASRAAAAGQARIDDARRAGLEWLVDEADPATVMAGVYQRVELHLPTGSAVVSTIEAGSAGAGVTYTVELLPGHAGAAAVSPQVFSNRAEWSPAVERLKARLSAGP
jgi:hypothetical protein